MKNASILVVPCCEKGKGGGHLTRCIKLVKDFHATGKEAYLYIPENVKIDKFYKSFQLDKSFVASEKGVIKSEVAKTETSKNEAVKTETAKTETVKKEITRIGITEKKWELIILDRNNTPQDELNKWKTLAPVIGIDEGGPERDNFDFLIDILIPENFEQPAANITSCGLLDLPQKTKTAKNTQIKNFKILVSFGQEDAAGLGVKTIKKLSKKYTQGMEITLIKGALNNLKYKMPEYVKVLDSVPNLSDHLCEYDLVITHYGITAYEALYAGTKVLLDHPTAYHKKIAKTAGFMDIKDLNLILQPVVNQASPELNDKPVKSIRAQSNKTSLAELINSLSMQTNRRCPVCGKEKGNASVARFLDRTYRHCSNCGIIYMIRTRPQPVEYKRDYFFESYKNQYGKTYLEDFPNLVATGKRRLKIISQILSHKDIDPMVEKVLISEKVLLDIGCAYGPFLVAARDSGYSPAGIEPAQDAARYVQKSLGLPAIQGFFPNCPLPTTHSPPYDVITMWYVIEHFNDCLTVLAEIKKQLKPNGILAFSTPSSTGISGHKSLYRFLEESPADHYTVWSPKMRKKALAIAGFQVKKTVITGHHPERFPVLGKLAKSKFSPLYWLFLAASHVLGLGDTFEVYAQLV